ncbi:hypothetical protein AAE478_002101 [Parahypoxylon ruwenzoriense]
MECLGRHRRFLSEDEWDFLTTNFPMEDPKSWKSRQYLEECEIMDHVAVYSTVPGTCVCFFINTELLPLKVKARDILKDNYMKSHGGLSSLNLIIYHDICNIHARTAIISAFNVMDGPKRRRRWLGISPGEKGWEEVKRNNPLIIGAENLLVENEVEMGGAILGKVQFILDSDEDLDNWVTGNIHMKIELYRR